MSLNLSVVIPYHGRLKWLQDALNSVLNQEKLPAELIIVDDFSSENPLSEIEKIKKQTDVPVTYLRFDAHKGVSYARNAGIRLAKADYIAFLDADDCWSSGHLKDFSTALKQIPEIKFYSAAYRGFSGQCPKELSRFVPEFQIIDYFKLALKNSFLVNSSSVILSKDLIEKIGLFDTALNVMEDMDYWIRAGKMAPVVLNKNPRVFIRHSNRTSLSKRLEFYASEDLKKWFEKTLQTVENEEIKKFIHLNLYGTIMRFKKQGEAPPAWLNDLLNEKYLSVFQKLMLRQPPFFTEVLARILNKKR